MRPHVLPALAVLLLVRAAPADEARAVVERAVKEMGLDAKAPNAPAVLINIKFSGPNMVKGDGTIHYTANGPRRLELTAFEGEQKHTALVVITGNTAFGKSDEQGHDFTGDELAMLRTIEPLFSPLALPRLLADKDVTFKDLDEMRVDSRPARRIQAAIKGKTVDLYFDKETGLLLRTVAKIENVLELTANFSDYRELGRSSDELALKGAGVDEAGLVAFLRKRQPDPKGLEKATALVRKLGDDDFETREKAAAELIELGVVAIPAVQKATQERDAEVMRRARAILDILEKRNDRTLLEAAIRQVARTRPQGGIDVLLGLLPGASEATANEIKAALAALSIRDGKPERLLQDALDDRRPEVREAVAAALGRDGEVFLRRPGRSVFSAGYKLPARTSISVQGEKMELETTAVRYQNAVDAKLFMKP
jgi:hypothetical protein